MTLTIISIGFLALGAIFLNDPDLIDNHLRHWFGEITGNPIKDDDE